MAMSLTSIFCLVLVIVPVSQGGKILVFPHDGSHWVNMKVLVEELNLRGHSLTVIRTSDSWYITDTSPFYNTLTIDVKGGGNEEFFRVFVSEVIKIKRSKASAWAQFSLNMVLKDGFSHFHEKVGEMIVCMFENATLMRSLQEAKYDVVLTDPGNGGGVFLAHYLSLPIVLNARWTIHDVDYFSLFQAADLWLMRVDFVFEFPRPTMPNVVYMGGFQCKPAKPLPDHLEEFVQSSGEHGFIIMSLGTLIADLPADLAEEIAAAFAELPQKVIWRYKGRRPSTLGNNTLLVDWLPQNDLLGHPHIQLFVSHGGTNGIYEAIYHGVPVVGIPIVFDQADNLSRLKARGVARTVEISDLDRTNFQEAIQDILNDPSYRMNMQRLSRLRTESYKLPWYSYHSVDVIVFLLAAAVLLLFSIFGFLWFCFRLCVKRKQKCD